MVRHEVIEQVILLGLDDSSLVGAPPTSRIFAGKLADLRKPDAVIIDNTRLAKLFPGDDLSEEPKPPGMKARIGEYIGSLVGRLWRRSGPAAPSLDDQLLAKRQQFYARFLGRELEMNDHRAIIVGVCEATRTFQSNAVVYTTYSRAKQFIPQERKILSYVLVKVAGTESDQLTPAQAAGACGGRGRTQGEVVRVTNGVAAVWRLRFRRPSGGSLPRNPPQGNRRSDRLANRLAGSHQRGIHLGHDVLLHEVHRHPDQLRYHRDARLLDWVRRSPVKPFTCSRSTISSNSAH